MGLYYLNLPSFPKEYLCLDGETLSECTSLLIFIASDNYICYNNDMQNIYSYFHLINWNKEDGFLIKEIMIIAYLLR